MCGIAGAATWGASSVARLEQAVACAVDALAHRGPDGRGLTVCSTGEQGGPTAVLGHRRLAIIDLSDRAAQPMASPRVRLHVTYNGEIYNFAEVRDELERLGRRFTSASDTEVILQGYEQWGEGVVDRLRGMFAAAIWDGREGELILFRDRLGIKPLYLWRQGHDCAFASEVRALLASGLVPRKLDSVGLEQFLACQTVPPPRTLVEGVEMVRPGTIVRFDRHGGRRERRYWDLLESTKAASGVEDDASIVSTARHLLEESIRLHLVSDVPVGIFLSGGIDSSAVATLAKQAGVTPRTFAVGFPGTPFDEMPYARAAAKAAGADHTEIALSPEDLLAALPEALAGVDHPSGDGINTYVVARAVRQAGVKVALSGLGGDEFFGGYPSFRRLRRLAVYARAWRRSPRGVRAVAAAAVETIGASSVAAVKAAALVGTDGSLAETFPVLRQLFSPAQQAELLGKARGLARPDPYVTLLEAAFERHGTRPLMSLVSYAEARTYMHDVLLRDTDQMSMRHGLEVRVPLLDHRLVEYLMSLDDAAKRLDGRPKGLLLDSLPVALPPEVVDRRKQGFVLPFEPWMRGVLRDFCEHHLGPDGLGGRGVLEPKAVGRLWTSFLAGDRRTTWSRPWALVALDAWLDATGVAA